MTNEAVKPIRYVLPTRPYSVIDAINRCAAATGSVGYAMATADANYNGHCIGVQFNDYRGYWIAEYYWGERVVLCRGTIEQCLAAAKREYDRGARGCSVSCSPKTPEVLAACIAIGMIHEDAEDGSWYGPLHAKIGLASIQERGGCPALAYLANSKTVEEYEAKCEAFYAAVRARRALDIPAPSSKITS